MAETLSRFTAERGIATASCPSVRLSVCLSVYEPCCCKEIDYHNPPTLQTDRPQKFRGTHVSVSRGKNRCSDFFVFSRSPPVEYFKRAILLHLLPISHRIFLLRI